MKIARVVSVPDAKPGQPNRAFQNLQDNNFYLRMTTEAVVSVKAIGGEFSCRWGATDQLCEASNWRLATELFIPSDATATFSSHIGPRVNASHRGGDLNERERLLRGKREKYGPMEKSLADAFDAAEMALPSFDLHPIQKLVLEQQERLKLLQRQQEKWGEHVLTDSNGGKWVFGIDLATSGFSMVEQVASELKVLDTRCQNVSTTGFRCRHEVYERHACETPAGFPIGRIVAGQGKPGEKRHHFGGVILDLPEKGPQPKPPKPVPRPTHGDCMGAPTFRASEYGAKLRIEKIAALGMMSLDTLHDRLPRRWTKRAWRT